MHYSFDLSIGQLLDDPHSRKIFERNVPQLLHHPMLKMARGFRLRDIEKYASQVGISQQTIVKIRKELDALNRN